MWDRVCWFVMHSLRNIKWNFKDAFLTKPSNYNIEEDKTIADFYAEEFMDHYKHLSKKGYDMAFMYQFENEVKRNYERLSKENEDV